VKELHLICNAHLDPIWQWNWEEGAAAALSTFSSAADLCDEFDYIFCHNEVTLYKYIAEYAPTLFERIKALIKKGKWHIMGGWYLQPDLNMPSGESIVRQILVGRQYFMDNFGVWPETAIAFDAFGHSVGLPQIIAKCGQKNFLFGRSGCNALPDDRFLWQSPDGTQIKAAWSHGGYNSPMGRVNETIDERTKGCEHDRVCVLWGVGNHGGGPSRRDLQIIEEMKAAGTCKMLHSTPDTFFAEIDPTVVHDVSLRTVFPGCYTAMSRIKAEHAALENDLYYAEIAASAAALRGLIDYPADELNEAVEDLLNAEFHDVLPGTSIRAGEENGMQLLEHGRLLCNRIRARAFFALCGAEPKAAPGEYPILVLNSLPYTQTTEVACELMLADQNWRDDITSHLTITGPDGAPVAFQKVKEESNLNLDWRKKIIFEATLAPLSVTRFSLYADLAPTPAAQVFPQNAPIILDTPCMHAAIDRTTGSLTSFCVDGREYLSAPVTVNVYDDLPDPWRMDAESLSQLGTNERPCTLMEKPDGPFEGMSPVQVIENGDIYLGVEAFLRCENTRVRIEYDLYKRTPKVDVKIDVFAGDANRVVKLALPTSMPGDYIGQTAFATETLAQDGSPQVAQRFVAKTDADGNALGLLSAGIYGSACRDGVVTLTLLRTATYCAHPIPGRPVLPEGRFTKKMDMGERNFTVRLVACRTDELDKLSLEFNRPPFAVNVFPVQSDVAAKPFAIGISDTCVTLVTFKKREGAPSYILRLLNDTQNAKDVTLTLCGTNINLHFGRYEVKTVEYVDGTLNELAEIVI